MAFSSAEDLARVVVNRVYATEPLESRNAVFKGVLEITTILINELFGIGCGRPNLTKMPGEDEFAAAARIKFEAQEVNNMLSSLRTNNLSSMHLRLFYLVPRPRAPLLR